MAFETYVSALPILETILAQENNLQVVLAQHKNQFMHPFCWA